MSVGGRTVDQAETPAAMQAADTAGVGAAGGSSTGGPPEAVRTPGLEPTEVATNLPYLLPAQVPPASAPPVSSAPLGLPAPPAPATHLQLASAMSPVLHAPDGSYSLELQLRPHGLGLVHVAVELRGGELSLSLSAADAAARDVLRDSLPDLRQQLEAQGLRTADFDVGSGGRRPQSHPAGDENPASRGSDPPIARAQAPVPAADPPQIDRGLDLQL
jgi:flagellar hook-length control protein FliK